MLKWLAKTGPKEDVKISDIGINSYQVRFSNVDEKIDEMEEMLTVAGKNFQPILICKADPELPFRYDIIYGQRRLTAAKNLAGKQLMLRLLMKRFLLSLVSQYPYKKTKEGYQLLRQILLTQ